MLPHDRSGKAEYEPRPQHWRRTGRERRALACSPKDRHQTVLTMRKIRAHPAEATLPSCSPANCTPRNNVLEHSGDIPRNRSTCRSAHPRRWPCSSREPLLLALFAATPPVLVSPTPSFLRALPLISPIFRAPRTAYYTHRTISPLSRLANRASPGGAAPPTPRRGIIPHLLPFSSHRPTDDGRRRPDMRSRSCCVDVHDSGGAGTAILRVFSRSRRPRQSGTSQPCSLSESQPMCRA